jgi:hypothetical protein
MKKIPKSGCDKQNKKHLQQFSGIEIRLTFDIFINIDPNQFQTNGWNHGSL